MTDPNTGDANRAKPGRAAKAARAGKAAHSNVRGAGTGPHASPPSATSVVTRSSAYMEPSAREAMIAEAAFYRSAHRGFEPGHEVDDWLAAESEIDAARARGDLPTCCG